MSGAMADLLNECRTRYLGGPGSGNPNQARDNRGRWVSGDGGVETNAEAEDKAVRGAVRNAPPLPEAVARRIKAESILRLDEEEVLALKKNIVLYVLQRAAGGKPAPPELIQDIAEPPKPTADSKAFDATVDAIATIIKTHPNYDKSKLAGHVLRAIFRVKANEGKGA